MLRVAFLELAVYILSINTAGGDIENKVNP
jgi:hypothetical protein